MQVNYKRTELPDSKIIHTLIEKSNSKNDYDFNYISELEELRNKISIEVSQINVLFPEYTPHDEKYHLKRLFYIADLLLGDELIENMNVTELFLLSVGLYAHDWGMAITEEEKEIILNAKKSPAHINLLDNESNKILQFCNEKSIKISDLDIENWREYVRRTHAFRSGKRIKTYFDIKSSGIAEFASRICEGHWLDFNIIEDFILYPTDASIHRDIVNIKAITLYVRLIDLLDLGEDRTPYILWKFVAPRNKFSKMEWAKHRVLQPITLPQYQHGRYIQVEGSTEDHSVYMSIMDLKRYVDAQFRHSCDILNRINHSYHRLNVSHIDWRVAARGFTPSVIQFEFDRTRMFDILGDEIYRSNPYIFIRELLQNAIDAITLRKEILEKKEISFNPKININVVEDEDCFVVQIQDNGIGMDEYIIKNYLAIAGKSYYKSPDFYREGLKMDPISRFGIGVLSCFMVADYIEIDTFKDPITTQQHEQLSILIPAKDNYFIVKKGIKRIDIGTTFRIYVVKNKLPKNKNNTIINFNVTEYLKKIASFVEYPIYILENNSLSILKNPNHSLQLNNGEYCMDYSFPMEKAFLPQCVEEVKELFEEKRIYLKSDLKLNNFDGCLTFLLPKCNNIDIINTGHSWPLNEMSTVNYKTGKESETKIKISNKWRHVYSTPTIDNMNIPDRFFSIFMDGILLTDIDPPEMELQEENKDELIYGRSSFLDTFTYPQVIVNIPKSFDLKIDLARTQISTKERWDKPVWEAFYKFIRDNIIKEVLSLPLKDRLLNLAKLITFYRVTPENMLKRLLIDKTNFPIPFLDIEGNVFFKEYNKETMTEIIVVPQVFIKEIYNLFVNSYIGETPQTMKLANWKSDTDSLIRLKEREYSDKKNYASLQNAIVLISKFISENYYLSSIKFIYSPNTQQYPIVQECLKIKSKDFELLKKLNSISKEDIENEHILYKINTLFQRKIYSCPKVVKFSNPYQQKLFYSFEYFNINTDYILDFINLCMAVIKAKEDEILNEKKLGRLSDMLNEIPFFKLKYDLDTIHIDVLNKKIQDLYNEAIDNNIIKYDKSKVRNLVLDDFVENSINIIGNNTFTLDID